MKNSLTRKQKIKIAIEIILGVIPSAMLVYIFMPLLFVWFYYLFVQGVSNPSSWIIFYYLGGLFGLTGLVLSIFLNAPNKKRPSTKINFLLLILISCGFVLASWILITSIRSELNTIDSKTLQKLSKGLFIYIPLLFSMIVGLKYYYIIVRNLLIKT